MTEAQATAASEALGVRDAAPDYQSSIVRPCPKGIMPGYKQTEVGIIPEDWIEATIGSFNPFITSGSRGWARYYSSYGDLFVRITNMTRKSIYLDLGDVRFVSVSDVGHEGKRTRLVRGDVLISITADIGIVSYVDGSVPLPAYINQHISLVRFQKDEVLPKYVALFLAVGRGQNVFRAITDQGAKAGINLQTVRKVPLALPPTIEEQRAIAGALSDVDALLEELDRLIAKKRDIKQATMQQLLTAQTRLPGFHDPWQTKKLYELLKYERPEKYLVSDTDYKEQGDTPVLTANISFILGYTNEAAGLYTDVPVIIFDDFTTNAKYVGFRFKVKSSAIKILKPRASKVNLKFVYERMKLIKFPLGEHKRYYISEYQHLELAVPQPDEQKAIAAVLADMDAEIEALEERRAKTADLKQGMMQELLTGRIRLVGQSKRFGSGELE